MGIRKTTLGAGWFGHIVTQEHRDAYRPFRDDHARFWPPVGTGRPGLVFLEPPRRRRVHAERVGGEEGRGWFGSWPPSAPRCCWTFQNPRLAVFYHWEHHIGGFDLPLKVICGIGAGEGGQGFPSCDFGGDWAEFG